VSLVILGVRNVTQPTIQTLAPDATKVITLISRTLGPLVLIIVRRPTLPHPLFRTRDKDFNHSVTPIPYNIVMITVQAQLASVVIQDAYDVRDPVIMNVKCVSMVTF